MDRSALLGMTIGAAVMFGFGSVWLVTGLVRGNRSPKWLYVALLFAGVVLGGCIAILGAKASGLPRDSDALTQQQVDANRRVAQHFYVILGIEIAAIALSVAALNALRYPSYILSGIALIVAVHFFPLAALFRAPVYYGAALGGSAIGLVGFFIDDDGLRQKVVGLSFGALLWATASWIAGLGLISVSRMATLPPS